MSRVALVLFSPATLLLPPASAASAAPACQRRPLSACSPCLPVLRVSLFTSLLLLPLPESSLSLAGRDCQPLPRVREPVAAGRGCGQSGLGDRKRGRCRPPGNGSGARVPRRGRERAPGAGGVRVATWPGAERTERGSLRSEGAGVGVEPGLSLPVPVPQPQPQPLPLPEPLPLPQKPQPRPALCMLRPRLALPLPLPLSRALLQPHPPPLQPLGSRI